MRIKEELTVNYFNKNREKHGVVITDDIGGTHWAGKIFSLVDEENNRDNGEFCIVGGKIANEREISEALVPTAAMMGTHRAVLIASPAEIYYGATPEQYEECYFYNEKGKPMRCYELREYDQFSVTEYTLDTVTEYDPEAGTGGAVKGNYVILQDGSGRLAEVNSEPTGHAFYAEIIDVDSAPLRPYMMIGGKRPARMIGLRVVRNHPIG
jgi:hypothetical protein